MEKVARVLKISETNCAEKAAEVLKKGGVIVYPTETLYGIGGLSLNKTATEKIYSIKKRTLGTPILVLVKDLEMLKSYFIISDKHWNSYKKFEGKPLTLILREKINFPDIVSAGTRNIGVRISSNDFVKELFHYIDEPITSTSANISGEKNVYRFHEIINEFKDKVDLAIDSGNLPPSKGSTVLDLTTDPPHLVREGDIGKGELKEFFIGRN